MITISNLIYRAAHTHCNSKWVGDKQLPHIRVCCYCPNGSFEVELPRWIGSGPAFSPEQKAYEALSYEEKRLSYVRHAEEEAQVIKEKIVPHLVEVHGFTVCDQCDSLVKKTGLRAHKRSFSCEEVKRQQIMSQRGLVNATIHACALLSDIECLATEMKQHVHWEDCATRDFIDDECRKAQREFSRVGELSRAYTSYETGVGWKEQIWAPRAVSYYMEAVRKRHAQDRHARLADVWQFLSSSDFERECALGLIELALDE